MKSDATKRCRTELLDLPPNWKDQTLNFIDTERSRSYSSLNSNGAVFDFSFFHFSSHEKSFLNPYSQQYMTAWYVIYKSVATKRCRTELLDLPPNWKDQTLNFIDFERSRSYSSLNSNGAVFDFSFFHFSSHEKSFLNPHSQQYMTAWYVIYQYQHDHAY